MGATCVLPSVASLTGRTVFRYVMKNQQCAFAQWRRGNHFTVTRGHFSKSLEECIHCRSNWVCCCVMCTKSRRWAAAAQLSFSSVQPKSFNSSPVVQRMTEVAISQLAELSRTIGYGNWAFSQLPKPRPISGNSSSAHFQFDSTKVCQIKSSI